MQTVTAIFDIGKTNKKFLLYDENLQIVREEQVKIPEMTDEDGFPCDDLSLLTQWIHTTWAKVVADKQFFVKQINFTTYGASFVHLDKNGKALTPLYNYLKPFPEELLDSFYQKYGDKTTLAVQTASPPLAMLNSGLQLYWLKYHKPDLFKQVHTSLHFPQYCAYLFSRRLSTEFTSIGCHTMLWDFVKKDYHAWVYQEELHQLFPPIVTSYVNGTTLFREHQIPCGVGLHDSSAALIPYKKLTSEPFILLSTGTWGIVLNPFSTEPLSESELLQDCLKYLTFEGQSVKASRLFIGNLHEQVTEKLAEFFHKSNDYFKNISTRPNFNIDEKLRQTCIFHEDNLNTYNDYEEAYATFMLDLVQKQAQKIKLIMDKGIKYKKLFIDGGFAKNPIFLTFLAYFFPTLDIQTVSFAQGTSLGAAQALFD
ncbi:MAG: FGGY-family carbohydrate kinase [Thermoflexibacter sp.]